MRTNPSGVDRHGTSTLSIIASRFCLTALFDPKHGVRGNIAAGEKVPFGDNPEFGVPEYSLYGDSLRPTPEQLEKIDMQAYDMQDVGLRSYTFLSTLANSIEACAEAGIPILVLDRPNPLGGKSSLAMPDADTASFVSALPIPFRHGFSSGEYANLAQKTRAPRYDLTLVRCDSWHREDFRTFWQPWLPPSPALPSFNALLCYATNYLLQATNFSVGRQTAEPFTLLGTPYADAPRMAAGGITQT